MDNKTKSLEHNSRKEKKNKGPLEKIELLIIISSTSAFALISFLIQETNIMQHLILLSGRF